jgi:hypothetical protein
LTKKSTEDHLLSLQRAGKLVHYDRSLWPDETCLRRLWLHPSIEHWVMLPGKTAEQRAYFAHVRAFFSAFIGGADFDDDDMLKPLSEGKEGLWDFRITFQPQMRVAGAFLRKGEFVALAFDDRARLDKRGFGEFVGLVKRRFATLFPEHLPLMKPRPWLLQEFDDDI